MITPDELEILRKPEVQEHIRKFGRQLGDVVIDPDLEMHGSGIITSYSGEHCFGVTFEDGFQCGYAGNSYAGPALIITPDCISRDSSRPERGLWGCLKPFISGGMNYYPYVDATAMSDQVMVGFRCGCASIIHWIGTPRLALLKALEWQIEMGEK